MRDLYASTSLDTEFYNFVSLNDGPPRHDTAAGHFASSPLLQASFVLYMTQSVAL